MKTKTFEVIMIFEIVSFLLLPVFLTSPIPETPEKCHESYTMEPGDTCFDVAVMYGLNLTELQAQYDCDTPKVGTKICVSETPTCQLRARIPPNVTDEYCKHLSDVYQTTLAELEEINDGVKCDSLPVGRKLCVWPATDRRYPANTTCIQWAKSEESDEDCSKLREKYQVAMDHFSFLNPGRDCRKNSRLCVRDASFPHPCKNLKNIEPNDTCDGIRRRYGLTEDELLGYNPFLRCNRVSAYHQICVAIDKPKVE